MERNTNKRLLDKQRRVDAILLSLQQSGADESQWKDVRNLNPFGKKELPDTL